MDDWYFKCSVKEFPFEDMADEAVKIKFTPIWLWWQSHRQSSSDGELEGRAAFQLNRGWYYGTSRWFCPPPKVRIVPGILGPPPSMVTRVKHPEGVSGRLKITFILSTAHLIRSLPVSSIWTPIIPQIPLPDWDLTKP
jgi:hypothetical protein